MFIDTEHTYKQAKLEYDLLLPSVRPGGMALFDDIEMNGMAAFWAEVRMPKQELSHLHRSGFGISKRRI